MATQYATVRLAETASTQDVARQAFDPAAGPVLVVADRQTAGRGRSGRGWIQAPTGLAASLALRLDWPEERLATVTLVAGLAAHRALTEAAGGRLALKWPNDVVDDQDRKVAGLLAEQRGGTTVIGLGANLHWPDPPPYAAPLFAEPPPADTAARIASRWAEELLARVAHGPDLWGREEYVALCVTLGRRITWQPRGAGLALDVASDGSLLVDREGHVEAVRSGEVATVRPANVAPARTKRNGEASR